VAYVLAMKPMPQSAVDGNEAADYADLVSMIDDLGRVIQTSDALSAYAEEENAVVEAALWESAVITYGRCFTSGKSAIGKRSRRKMPTEALDTLSPELREAHEQVMELRNRHVGHRVGEAGAVRVVAVHEYIGGPPLGVGCLRVHMILPDNHVDLPRLAHSLLSYLQPLADREADAVLGRLQQEHGVEPRT